MIVHLDADAFFASVEQAADPKLRGKAIAVGGEKRGIIASASYEARKLGIYTPMPSVRARKLCPKLIILPGDFAKYEQFSRFMFSYAYDFTPHVEIASIDEGYFDLSGNRQKDPIEVAAIIRKAIRQSLKISVSEGIASNKLVSQIASKLKKPSCFIDVAVGSERTFLSPLANHWLPGVGPKLATTLNTAGLTLIHQIASTSIDLLSMFVGNQAKQLNLYAQGIDDRPVVADRPDAKSYSEQNTFNEDVTDEAFILANLRAMADRLMRKVREDGKSIRTVTLRLRYNDMDEVTRSQSLEEPTDLELDVYPLFLGLLRKAWERRVSIRLVGVKFSNIYDGYYRTELPLEENARKHESHRRLAPVLDELRRVHFSSAFMRGHDLWLKEQNGQPRKDLAIQKALDIHVAKSLKKETKFVPLNLKSHYSFLNSLLSIETMIDFAKSREIQALAITDPNLHGAVEFYQSAKAAGIKPIIGAEITVAGLGKTSSRCNLYVQNKAGYENLCHLLSQKKVTPALLQNHRTGLIQVAADGAAFPEIRYLHPADQQKFNIIQSIRTLTLLNERHPEKRRGNFHFPTPDELALVSSTELQEAQDIANQCEFEFELTHLRFPHFFPADGSTAKDFLRKLAHAGLETRYGHRAIQFRSQLEEELTIIGEVGYEEYFLTVWDILEECKRVGIQWITRGSAADSLVCYCLGISGVCPIRFELYFKRFLNQERMKLNKLPDIDIDFAHDRKDDVVDIIFARYQQGHVAVVGGFSTFQARSAVAEIGKVLGISEHQIRRLTQSIPWTAARNIQTAIAVNQECRDLPIGEEPYKTVIELAAFLDGFPRYPKMHPCGLVLSRDPIASLTPTFISNKGLPTTHFDMDAVEAVGLIKMDILAQGGLAVIRDTLALLKAKGMELDLEHLAPWEDAGIWEMVSKGESRGVHHIESPAMISLAKMCHVRDIDCLIAIVSVIRPGAANNMKKAQFARRAQGLEEPEYIHPSLEPVLRSTFGVVAYEEHILQICEAFANLSPGRGDVLRRALVKQKTETIAEIREEFIRAARKLRRTEVDIKAVWSLMEGFQGYAFCRAHSTAYGVEAYQGALLKRYHPAEFLASVLSNGKGFYTPLAYTLECRRLGMEFLAPDINLSRDKFFPEKAGAVLKIRVPVGQVKDLTAQTVQEYRAEREKASFQSMADFYQRIQPIALEMENLIRVGAFDSFGETRTAQMWNLRHLLRSQVEGEQKPLFAAAPKAPLPEIPLTEPTHLDHLKAETELLGFAISGHPLDMFADIAWESYCTISSLGKYPDQQVTVCGLIIQERSYSQVTGDKMKFLTIADYTGMVECELFADTYRRFGIQVVRNPVIELTAIVTPYENKQGYSLQVQFAGKPRVQLTSRK